MKDYVQENIRVKEAQMVQNRLGEISVVSNLDDKTP